MDIRELYYLNALEEEGSISKAAERLFIAQASLSQFLRQFESQLGSPLFVRTNKGIRPTPSGKVFLGHTRHILREYQQAQQEFWDNENTVGGTVYFGISSFRGSYIIPPILKKFYDQNPRASVNIYEGNSMALVQRIREGELDLALSAYPIVSTEGIQMEYLYRDELVLVATRDHPIMDHVRRADDGTLWVPMEEITHYECILSGKDTMLGHLIRSSFGAYGLQLNARHDNITADFAASMGRAGIALAFTYRSCIVEQPNVVYLSLGTQRLYLRLALLSPATDYRSKATLAFTRLLREELSAQNKKRTPSPAPLSGEDVL